MNKITTALIFILITIMTISSNSHAQSFYDLEVKSLDNKIVKMSDYKNKVLLVVNTASKCGFTPQYRDLQELYTSYKDKDFVVLGFPSNDFGDQEPGSNEEIKKFCKLNYGVTFPLFERSPVSGENKQPLYKFLLETIAPNMKEEVQWNFEKFVVDKNGSIAGRFGSQVNPLSAKITTKIDELLK